MRMAIVGFNSKEKIIEEIEKLLKSRIVLFSVVTTKGSYADEAAAQLGAPTIYVKDYEELKHYADWWLIYREGLPQRDFNILINYLKKKDLHGKVI